MTIHRFRSHDCKDHATTVPRNITDGTATGSCRSYLQMGGQGRQGYLFFHPTAGRDQIENRGPAAPTHGGGNEAGRRAGAPSRGTGRGNGRKTPQAGGRGGQAARGAGASAPDGRHRETGLCAPANHIRPARYGSAAQSSEAQSPDAATPPALHARRCALICRSKCRTSWRLCRLTQVTVQFTSSIHAIWMASRIFSPE